MSERGRALLLCAAVYLVALGAALFTGLLLRGQHPLVLVGLADLVGTVVVFAASLIWSNSSLYDPYWSVAPLPMAAALWQLGGGELALRPMVLQGLIWLWGLRLTYNWASGWQGLSHEDWRYRRIRAQTGRLYWPVSFLGIHLMPTLMVFGGCLPLWPALGAGARPVGWLDGIALVVTLTAVWFEALADHQLRRFVRTRSDSSQLLQSGLWAYSRHPNYFGEILFWWGIGLFGLAADPGRYWVLGGALCMTLLFVCISLPLIERRMLERKPAYAAERRRRSLLVPWPPKR